MWAVGCATMTSWEVLQVWCMKHALIGTTCAAVALSSVLREKKQQICDMLCHYSGHITSKSWNKASVYMDQRLNTQRLATDGGKWQVYSQVHA